jgi:peroxisomal membrane protein 2
MNPSERSLHKFPAGDKILEWITTTPHMKYERLVDLEEARPADDPSPFKLGLIKHLSTSMDESSPLLGEEKRRQLQLNRQHTSLWKWYSARLDSDPLATKMITSAILVGLGDAAGQGIEYHFAQFDLERSFRFVTLGFFIQAPSAHYFYHVLDGNLPPTRSPWTWTTLIKGLIDQLVFAPSFTILIFFYLDTLQGLTIDDILQHIYNDYCDTMIANWKVWGPATVVNMIWIQPSWRVLYSNVVFFIWTIILSLMMSSSSSLSP